MELALIRTKYPDGTNGELRYEGNLICYAIELPWLLNRRNLSCIPDGRYRLLSRYTPKHKLHLYVADVPGRSGILLHPANNAKRELLGCIAPVLELTGPGQGRQSRLANEILKSLVLPVIHSEEVWLTITAKTSEILNEQKHEHS
jgi:hypothetical protein